MAQPPTKSSLTREQKTGFVLLFVFALLTVSVGFLQMRNALYNPFVLKTTNEDRVPQELVVDESAKLQAIDTDQDGLNNYEELFFYETSPYLPDTDSDGIKDREEIVAGKDPNCPEGKVCTTTTDAPVTSTPGLITSPLNGSTSETLGILDQAGFVADEVTPSAGTVKDYLNDPQKLRELVRQSGQLTEAQLLEINDATLLEIAKSIVGTDTSVSTDLTSTTTLP